MQLKLEGYSWFLLLPPDIYTLNTEYTLEFVMICNVMIHKAYMIMWWWTIIHLLYKVCVSWPRGPASLRPARGLNGLMTAPMALIHTGIVLWLGFSGRAGNPHGSTSSRCFTLRAVPPHPHRHTWYTDQTLCFNYELDLLFHMVAGHSANGKKVHKNTTPPAPNTHTLKHLCGCLSV